MTDYSDAEVLHKGNWLTLMKRDDKYEFSHRHRSPNAVSITALAESGELILVSQPRIPHRKTVLETPAGLVDEGENSRQAAMRELHEETGYTGTIVDIIENVTSSPGVLTEKLDYVFMINCFKIGEGGGVDDENIKIHLVKPDLQTIRALCSKNDWIFDSKLFSAISMIKSFRY